MQHADYRRTWRRPAASPRWCGPRRGTRRRQKPGPAARACRGSYEPCIHVRSHHHLPSMVAGAGTSPTLLRIGGVEHMLGGGGDRPGSGYRANTGAAARAAGAVNGLADAPGLIGATDSMACWAMKAMGTSLPSSVTAGSNSATQRRLGDAVMTLGTRRSSTHRARGRPA
jgi:hypothetical protein